ncbi:MAG: Nif3-like dinuclear metal center hexameric protein [Liquorilactobacillus ghanensis]|uniref:Nif3-like dinuclear metal center hexameric protein n=1 Tax=Liquorilactobacillus ghanensis TaxID=399370 RepID=UPI0039ECC056
MKIAEVVSKIKNYYKGVLNGEPISEDKTRDKILYGKTDIECTGIVTTTWATTDVIKRTVKLGANLIICHEALFWNHGDKQDWLIESKNQTYFEKKKLLDETGVTIWRNHDYVHSGIPLTDGTYKDGIFWGFAKYLGWEKYWVNSENDDILPIVFNLPQTTGLQVANKLIETFNLNGARIEGNPETIIKKAVIPYHNLGDAKKEIRFIDKQNINLVIGLELIDFTLAEYIRDSSMLGKNKCIVTVGHFNTEEAGMRYMVNYIPKALQSDIPCYFVQSGDMYSYLKKTI